MVPTSGGLANIDPFKSCRFGALYPTEACFERICQCFLSELCSLRCASANIVKMHGNVKHKNAAKYQESFLKY
jgi:hypothetical protein